MKEFNARREFEGWKERTSMRIFTSFSILFNFLFASYYAFFAIRHSSVWYGSLAAYTYVLMIMRGVVLFRSLLGGRYLLKQLKTYRTCGALLLVFALALSVALVEMVLHGAHFERVGHLIYVTAVYAFTKVIIAIVNFARAAKRKNYLLRAARNINLCGAAVSLLTLQTALLHSFGNDAAFAAKMNAITGGLVLGACVVLGIWMIVHSKKEEKRILSADEIYYSGRN